MFFKINNILFMMMMFLSTFLIISSSNWIMSWMSLEFNLMVFIPLLNYKIKFNNSSSSMKYFLIQAMGSSLIMLSIMLMLGKSTNYSMVNYKEIISMALMIKLGMPPFHFWVPQVMEMINLIKISLILIWQKIAPLILISYSPSFFLLISISVSCFFGALGGFNQNNIKKILFYSSLIHLAWLVVCILINEKIWMFYYFFYSIMMISIIFMCYEMKILFINQLIKINNHINLYSFIFMIFMLAGLPPFMGFLMKISIIMIIIKSNWLYLMSIPLIFSSVVSIFYYLKIIWLTLMINSINLKYLLIKKYYKLNYLNFFILFINMFIPIMVFLT